MVYSYFKISSYKTCSLSHNFIALILKGRKEREERRLKEEEERKEREREQAEEMLRKEMMQDGDPDNISGLTVVRIHV